ncbi:sugar ABC transporter permease [Xylanimonas oleitrophica]|uniref:Sugar ABC transporter permease n=1 Tax=Xylanimonas oleitrophica TaxID=2607479 RepID=A0A2W5WUI7_9MICO|nr:sugar ABC transporter permease [Xylanimonas oleitrophica]PZR55149.1 sugar ABC transporter permease [Xylanimonas oleitrophica]
MTSSTTVAPPGTGLDAPPRRRRRRGSPFPYVLLAPSLAVLLVLVGYPLVNLIITSFQHYGREQAFGQPPTWAGLENYTTVLTSETFYRVLGRSFAFMVVAVVTTFVLGTLLALLMMRLGKAMRMLVSIGLLLAWAMPALTSVIVWGWMFDTQFGVVNHVLTLITGQQWAGHSWLIDPLSFFGVLLLIIVWQGAPFIAFTMYAGLTQVPHEVLEAAQLDGAGAAQRFFRIQVPYVRTIITVLIVLSIIWDLRLFAQVYALQGIGGIVEETSTLGVWIYQVGTASGNYGMSAAAAVVMVVIMLVISSAYVRQTLKEED